MVKLTPVSYTHLDVYKRQLGMVRKLGREHADKNTHNNLYEHLKAVAVLGGADKIQETDVKQLSLSLIHI